MAFIGLWTGLEMRRHTTAAVPASISSPYDVEHAPPISVFGNDYDQMPPEISPHGKMDLTLTLFPDVIVRLPMTIPDIATKQRGIHSDTLLDQSCK
jgi:hypothetical protein